MVAALQGFNGNVSSLGKYTANAGLTNFQVSTDTVNSWASENATDWGKAFSTSVNLPDYGGDLLAAPAFSESSNAWTFITAPQSVSYSVSAEVQRVSIFGSNAPPVVASSRGMRDLTLSEALMEGFTLGKSVQKNLDDLENLMNVEVNSESGFVSVPVYNVFAGGKDYGLYIIEQIDVDEQMRDLQGRATRAMVGVALKQVPAYQVGTGVDQAGSSTGGQALDSAKFSTEADKQAKNVAKNAGNTKASTPGTTAAATTAANKAGGTNTNPTPVTATDPTKRVT
jgi:hypothetical protein